MPLGIGNNLIRNGGGLNPDGLALDLQFAADKALTARKGPTPVLTRASTATYFGPLINVNGEAAIPTTGVSAGRAYWSKTVGGTETVVSYTGSRWRVEVIYFGEGVIYEAAEGVEWRPDQADWSGSGISVTTSSTFGIVRAANNEPRFDHDPVTLASRGLLIEEGRTNLITGSNAFNTWTTANCTVAASSVVTPEGTADAWKIVEGSLTATHTVARSFSPVSGTTYTVSVWVKSAENGFAFLGLSGGGFATTFISANFSTGAVSTALGTPIGATSVAHSNGWWRVSFSLAATASLSSNIEIRLSRDGNWANRSYLGNGVNGIHVYGAQVEAGSFPTSYIPTTTSALARGADVCTIANTSSFWNSSEFTLLTKANLVTSGVDAYASNFNITGGFFGVRRTNTNAAVGIIRSGSNEDINFGSFTTGSLRMALAHSTGQQAGSLNGASTIQRNSAFAPSLNPPFNIGYSGSGAYISGHIVAIRYYRKRLANAKLQALTA